MRSWNYSSLISALVSLSAAAVISTVAYQRSPSLSLLISENGDLTLLVPEQKSPKIAATVSRKSYTTSVFCMLCIDGGEKNTRSRFIIWRDSVDDNSFRRLCRIIRLTRHQI